MARRSKGKDADAGRGGDALREGRWAEARARFEDEVAAAPSPEAYEGLSWAAWWLDDADAVFAAREHAYRLYRRRGDAAGAGRMATWLAADQLDFRGARAVASGWLARARRLLAPLPPGAEHGWLAFHEGHLANLGGDVEAAAERAARAAELGRDLGVADLEMLGLALRGSTLVARARIDEGLRCLDEATAMALAGEATIPISCAWACCYLVSACTSVLDFERASEWCDRIAELSARHGSRYLLGFCRAEYGAVYLWCGRWREAEAVLEASLEDLAQSRPLLVGGPLAALAELRRRQGRAGDAATLLERAGASSAAQLVGARLALDRGEPARAIEIVERLLRQMPAHRTVGRVPALELLVRARLGCGDHAEAAAALAALRDIRDRVGTALLAASVDRAAGMVAAAARDHAAARVLLEDAVDRFERSGAPFDAAVARLELATSLLALGDGGGARRELGLARSRLRELGARADADRADRALAAASGAGPPVTAREAEVLGLLAQGLTNRQIGDRLGVSEHTVHRHVANILRKLELPSRAAAAAHAIRLGLVGA